MLTASFLRQFEIILGKKLGQKIHIRRVQPISGGSINLAARVDTTSGTFFLKANDAFRFPQMFEKEERGLQALRNTKSFTIPEVVLTGEEEEQSFLLLRFIESRPMAVDFWESFGRSLAKLHRNTADRFGLTEDNYIGSLVQSNKEHNRWTDFFIEERMEVQLKLAMDSGKMNSTDNDMFRRFYSHYESLVKEEPSALLHGDLWNGNFMSGANGEPCIFDPAVYYGHREMDLSMSRLFGGFDERFYESYNTEFPLEPGFEERVNMHNLYPLMVHVNLFGGGYVSQVRSILKSYQ